MHHSISFIRKVIHASPCPVSYIRQLCHAGWLFSKLEEFSEEMFESDKSALEVTETGARNLMSWLAGDFYF